MNIHHLRSFLAAAEESSVTRAAEMLFLTQPAVTQHIRALERELGVTLFDRTGRGLQLTVAGEALQDYAHRSLALLEEGKHVIADLQSGISGHLALGAGVTTSIYSLPTWLRAFREAFPAIDVTVRTGRSQEVEAMVLAREIDLGIVTSLPAHPDIHAIDLFEDEIVFVAPPHMPLTGESIPLHQLNDIPLILFPQGGGFRAYLDRALSNAGCVPYVKMETDSVEAIKSFVEVGLGASFLPMSATKSECSAGTLMRVNVQGLPTLTRTTYVIHRADRYMNTATRNFLDTLIVRYHLTAG